MLKVLHALFARNSVCDTKKIIIKYCATGDGNVLYLVSKTDKNSVGSCAEVTTKYMTTAGKCLMLFYQWLNSGTLSIYIRNEEYVTKLVTTKTSSNAQATPWQRLFVTLPSDSGLHQIIIKGTRQHNNFSSSSAVTTGIVIDDFSVRPCADFREYKSTCCRFSIDCSELGPIAIASIKIN